MMKTLGVLGGMGPMATAYYLKVITGMTDAVRDQDHLHILVDSRPQTPDRTGYILDRTKPDPFPSLVASGRNLRGAGAEVLAIPCNTSHYFYDRLTAELGLPIVHLIRGTAAHLKRFGVGSAGVMATAGTLETGLYQQELAAAGIRAVVPDAETEAKIMHVIYEDVKAGRPVEREIFDDAADRLRRAGAEVLILGCTELSILKCDTPLGAGYLDTLDVLAHDAILACGAALRPEYEKLITE